jgi:hypothetical protein
MFVGSSNTITGAPVPRHGRGCKLQKIVSVECFCGNEKKKAFIAESLFSKTGARALIELTPKIVAAQ